ncbi:MAG TPA: hypothetical protein VFM31_07400 [Nitrososphaeraceae archaeon]|jgi:hypothetical protein|nr:hypothetical protein [Nitrososphaeraceae archaeon]
MLTTIKNNKQITILSLIFIGLMIPNVIVYLEHSLLELGESKESAEKGSINKSTRQLGEGTFFALVAIGYIITSILVFAKPNNVVPYYAILVGTVAIIIVYYFRTMTGIPVIGTDLIIKEYTVDYRDVITKIAQQAFVIPLAMMLQRVYDIKKLKYEDNIIRRL